MTDTEFLTPGFAVFNGHVNKADEKARALMRRYSPDYLKRVEKLEREGNGIMHIFNVKPTPATKMYTLLVMAFANEGRDVDILKSLEAIDHLEKTLEEEKV